MNLDGRKARCAYCGEERASSAGLPFFEYRGPGSDAARLKCARCGFLRLAHERGRAVMEDRSPCPGFEAAPEGYSDLYYCGCEGWD